ncbi:MAG TPA: S26 family signal peptidase [Methanocella sp.]|jgi:signal peptidase
MKLPEPVRLFAEKHPFIYELATDILLALVIVVAVSGLLYAYAGTWPGIVSVVGDSMHPHMHNGDLVLLQGLERTSVVTSVAANLTGDHNTYSLPGDVIVYRPLGRTDVKPVIHRAMYWVNESEPMWPGGPAAPASGYITLGDNNGGRLDQSYGSGICPLQPVRKEWIIGVAKFNVPYLGHIRGLMPF